MTGDNVEWLAGRENADGTPTEIGALRQQLDAAKAELRLAAEINEAALDDRIDAYQKLATAEAEIARLRRAMEVVASLAGKDWLIGQLALAESLQNVMGENLRYAFSQIDQAKEVLG